MLWTFAFWKGAAERALKSFAQALVVFVGAAGVGVLDVDWPTALGVSVAFALASLLTSIGSADFVAGVPAAAGSITMRTTGPVIPMSNRGGPVEVHKDDAGRPFLAPTGDSPAAAPTDPEARAAARAAKIARARGESV